MRRISALLVTLVALSQTARAQSTETELRELLGRDLTALSLNMPIWMSQHLPAVMAPVGIGAGSGIDDDSGSFKLGVLTRLGLFNNFDDVGAGLELFDLQSKLPSFMAWPQVGLVAGVGLGSGFEVGADIQFLPEMDIAAEGLNLKASLVSVAATLRWRINKSEGLMPALVLGLGGAYYHGNFSVGAGYESPYTETVDGREVTGRTRIEAAPGVHWDLFQAAPELRLAWDVAGVFRPYVGVGLGLSFGTVGDRLSLRAEATVDAIDGVPVTEDPVVFEDRVMGYDAEPGLFTLRPHLGFDVLLGVIAFTAQLDLAVTANDKADLDLEEAAQSFDLTDPNLLFNEAARSSATQATLAATFAARVQF
jgi:hypothetical protein